MLLFGIIGLPVILPWVLLFEKRRKTFFRRLGWGTVNWHRLPGAQMPRPKTAIWIHALSVGEVLSAAPLVDKLAGNYGRERILLTTSTKTGFDIATRELKDRTGAIAYFPYDIGFAVKRRLSQITPAAIIIVETDIWPNFLYEVKKRRIPVMLVNARLSDKSFAGYKNGHRLFRPAFKTFDFIATQSEKDTDRFRRLGVADDTVATTGNIKFHQRLADDNPLSAKPFKQSMGIPPAHKLMVAGSIHPEEEQALKEAFIGIQATVPDTALIIAPRDPNRAGKIKTLFAGTNNPTRRLSDQPVTDAGKTTRIVIVDNMGVLRALYAVCDLAFVGGSLCSAGGHNPLEPAVFAKPILFGPDMRDFEEIAALLLAAGGGRTVTDVDDLTSAAAELLQNTETATQMGNRARQVFADNQGALERTFEKIKKHVIINS
jgi:3-deoxy-D-manno-octulosonic-acid transferase